MEGNNGTSGNGNEPLLPHVPVASAPEPVVTEAKKLAKEVIEVLTQSEGIWTTVSSKQTILHRLYAEQINVSEKFTDYYRLWRERDYTVSENIATFHRFTEIDEQTQVLSQMLDDYETKLYRAGKIVKDFIRDMKVHIGRLRSSLETVTSAQTLADLEQVEVPNLNWIESIPDPEIEILSDEWDEMQLDTRISQCLQQLHALIHDANEMDDSI